MSKTNHRVTYEAAIKASIQGNRQALVKTLYLMYSQRVTMTEETANIIINRSYGFCNLSSFLTKKYWNNNRINRMVKRLVLGIPSDKRCFSRKEWTYFPMDPVMGPFSPQCVEWVKTYVTAIAEWREITVPEYDFQTSCHVWVLDQIDAVNLAAKKR